MDQNVQIPLESNTGLCIQLESGGTSVWTIEKVIGYGGSSVVYRATQKSGRFAGRTGIVKEFYPQSLSRISRESGALIIPEEDKAEFESKKEHFFEGFSSREQFSVLDSDHAMALPHIFGEANNTWYAVSDENTGCTLSDFDRRELSLNRAAQIMYSLCSAIGALHERGYLYLDLKPDNINIYSLDGREHIRLFDFDTVQSKKKLREAKYSTYSDGWAPPEQKAWRVKDISERTDIYSLGAVFFWLLTGRKPVGDTYGDESTDNDIKRIKEETFDWRQFPLCADASDGVIELVQRIFRKTLNTASTRYDSVAKMKGDLSELINRTGGNPAVERILLEAKEDLSDTITEGIYVISKQITTLKDQLSLLNAPPSDKKQRKPASVNRFLYNADVIPYIGHIDELDFLTNMCENAESLFCWIGVYGDGGSGKTRLAYELCKRMDAKGWQITWPSHLKSSIDQIKTKLCTDTEDALICLDDIISDVDMTVDFIRWCAESSDITAAKIRLLILDRDFDHFLEECYNCCLYYDYSNKSYEFIDNNGLLKVSPCTEENVFSIISLYCQSVYNQSPDQNTIQNLQEKLKSIDCKNRPLYALFIADAWCNGADITNWDRTDALEMVINKESEKAINYIKLEYTKRSEYSKIINAYKLAVSCSTIIPNCEYEWFCSLFEEIYHSRIHDDSILWIFEQLGLLDEDQTALIRPFPDLISEYMCIKYINALDRKRTVGFILSLLRNDHRTVFTFANNICGDYKELLVSPSNMSILQYLLERVQLRTGELISQGLSEEDMEEFDNIKDSELAEQWIETHRPNYREIIDSAFLEVKEFFVLNHEKAFSNTQVSLEKYTYKGEYLFDWRCGKGSIEYADQTTYDGEWNMDEINGTGTMIYKSGVSYRGRFVEGRRCGQGTIFSLDGSVYEGSWSKDMRNGKGKATYPDGSCYDGEWLDGTREGYGKYLWRDGTVYDGEWKNGMPNGFGVNHYANGNVYEGDWHDGKRHGHGKMVYASGNIYTGSWENGYKHGYGKMTYGAMCYYNGEWKNGEKNGAGTESDGVYVLSGPYENGKKHGLFTGYKISCPEKEYLIQFENGIQIND